MRLSGYRKVGRVLVLFALSIVIAVSYFGSNPQAQEKTQLPTRTGLVNDFAGVLDEKTKQRLETILENVKQRSGIEIDLATVQTTGEQDIFAFSRRLAGDWDVGARTSKKSLLLVMSVNEKAVFTQFSKSVQGELPDGVLGELSLRVRSQMNLGQFSQGLSDGIDHFVAALSRRLNFSLQDIDQIGGVATAVPSAVTIPPATDPTAAASPAVSVEPTPLAAETPASIPAAAETTPSATLTRPRTTTVKPVTDPAEEEDESETVELTLTLPLAERVAKLKEFLETHPKSNVRSRATELLISSYAGLGDQLLQSGDSKGGIEQLLLAINEAPANFSEKLFTGVISQIPLNLYARGHRDVSYEAARSIEAKFGTDSKRLLAIAGFYLGVEDGVEAARVAAQAVKLSPDLAEAHQVLGRGLHISLRLDEAAAEYKRAIELDPNMKKGARRSLADLYRAAGKAEEALALYREQLTADSADKAARAGMVLSLFDLGRIEEGNTELASALQAEPRNLALLAGAAYWFAAHREAERALELGRKAVEIEPRYTWPQIAIARAFVDQKKPLEAERAIRFARQYGNFPTLDYELANVLAASGLYDEAAEVLLQSFTINDGQIETRLAGRIAARESDFIKLLAPERRASIFQSASADDPHNAAMLKALLSFAIAINPTSGERPNETKSAAAAKDFASGPDEMRVYRQLYAAGRLLKQRIAFDTVQQLTEAARSGADEALNVAPATVAVQADELRSIRAQALAQGGPPTIAEAPRNVLGNILRGRIEDYTGWTLYHQDKTDEAVQHLRRAANILPENTPAWRDALWHLGAALDQAGSRQEALSNYIKSYNAGDPDPGRRAVIEQLYQKTNGSLDGLEEKIGGKLLASNPVAEPAVGKPTTSETPTPVPTPEAQPVASPELSSTPTPAPIGEEVKPTATPEATPTPESTPSPTPVEQPSPDPTPRPTPSSVADGPLPGTLLPSTVKITGRVRDPNNAVMANVVVVLISPRGTVLATTTDTRGNFSFTVPPSQLTYRIIPSKDGFTFAPIDKLLAGFTEDVKDVDFVGTASRAP